MPATKKRSLEEKEGETGSQITDIIFDLKTTGLNVCDEITEIAACTVDGKNTFIAHQPELITHLPETLRKFVDFLVLHAKGGKVNLVGRMKLHFPFLYRLIRDLDCFARFEEVIHSVDTIKVAIRVSYIQPSENSDIVALAELFKKSERSPYLYSTAKTKFLQSEAAEICASSLWVLEREKILNEGAIKKIARAGLGLTQLREEYLKGGYRALSGLLSDENKENIKPTTDKKKDKKKDKRTGKGAAKNLMKYFEKEINRN